MSSGVGSAGCYHAPRGGKHVLQSQRGHREGRRRLLRLLSGLEGCQSQGDTLDEVLANIKEAAEVYLETLTPDEIGQRLSGSILTTSVEVSVAYAPDHHVAAGREAEVGCGP